MSASCKPWTVMLYMGDVKNGLEAADEQVLRELESVRGRMSNVECIYQVAYPDKTTRGRVTGTGEKEVISERPPIDITDPREISDFVDWVDRHYPSRYTALFVKDHGTGLEPTAAKGLHMQGIFLDGQTMQFMAAADLRTAIERTARRHVDVYGLDACDMASVELAYELRSVTSFFLATQVFEATAGWNYQNIVSHLEERGESLGPRQLVPYVVEQARDANDGNTIALEVAWMPALAAAIDQLAHELFPSAADFAIWAARRYVAPPADMVDLMKLVDDLKDQHDRWTLHGLRRIHAAYAHARVAGQGLSLFLPRMLGSRAFGTYGMMQLARSNYWSRLVSAVNSELLSSRGTGE